MIAARRTKTPIRIGTIILHRGWLNVNERSSLSSSKNVS
jgi:hypothetical protein